jgi:HSP20 family protein
MASHDLIRLMQSLFLPVGATFPESCWRPATDVYRTATGWLVKCELAGVRPEDLEVSVRGSVLTVRGKRRDWLHPRPCQCHQMEIAYSHFERGVALPCDLDRARISTEYDHGMLIVHIETEGEADHDD